MGKRRSIMAFVGIAIGAAAIPMARGQNALGTGNALDANLNPASGGINPPAAQQDYRQRNAIITGNVAGGRGFRGSVGYLAERDFRGSLGSNDLYRDYAYSAYSSPALFRLGSTYEQLRFGQSVGALEYTRAQSGDPSALRPRLPIPTQEILPQRIGLDRASLTSSVAFNLQDTPYSQIIGTGYDQENRPLVYSVSPSRGITVEPLPLNLGQIGLSPYDAARIRQDIEAGMPSPQLGAPFTGPLVSPAPPGANQQARVSPRLDQRVDARARVGRVDASLTPDYGDIVKSIADRYANNRNVDLTIEPELMNELRTEYQRVRDDLRLSGALDQEPRPGPGRGGIRTDQKGQATPPQPEPSRRERIEELQGAADSGGAATQPGAAPGPAPRSSAESPRFVPHPAPESDFADVLRHGKRIEKLAGLGQDRFNEVMSSAEAALRKGDYFVAERRFERALRFTPGHPLALAGTGHAQLGAGLLLSSSFTLRKLLIDQPEFIDATYAPALLPAQVRIDDAIKTLHERLKGTEDRYDHGFLLAYIGRQRGDRALVQTGLDAMAQAAAQDKLEAMLRKIWLGEPESAASMPDEAPVNAEK